MLPVWLYTELSNRKNYILKHSISGILSEILFFFQKVLDKSKKMVYNSIELNRIEFNSEGGCVYEYI